MISKADNPLRQPGVFGQMTWDTYTVVLLGFRTSEPHDLIADALDKAAIRLTSAFPFLAGQIIVEDRTSTSSGTYRIVPYPLHAGKSPIQRKDCTALLPTFDKIVEAKAPSSMLDGDILAPTKGMGYTYDYSSPVPVLTMQANFVTGGLILCFSSNHNALDMNGQGQLIKLFATACRGEEFDLKDVELGNMEESHFLRLAEERPSTLSASPPPYVPAEWRYWRFSAAKLAELKRFAAPKPLATSNGQTNGAHAEWISTDDALCAFYIQRLTALRLQAGRISPSAAINANRACNGRSKVKPPIPKQYMGHLVLSSDTTFPTAQSLVDAPVSSVAVVLRKSLKDLDDFHVRSLATLLDITKDKSTIFYGGACHVPGQNFLITSWAGLGLYSTDFGDIFGIENGKPEIIRRPKLTALSDLVYIMPKSEEGDIDVGMCLGPEDVNGLTRDEVWRGWAEYIG